MIKKFKSTHTSRTLMFAELDKVMSHSIDGSDFAEILLNNVTGKKSSSNIQKTATHIKSLYGFDMEYAPFAAFKYFWKNAESSDKPMLALIYAINEDDLLAESLAVITETLIGEKATIEAFENVIEKYHPNNYTANTRKSLAQNIASSWKQAGIIEGKVKNIRVQRVISYYVAGFAFLTSYLKGNRGEFIWNNVGVKALGLSENRLRELAVECAKRDLMQYQYAGSVTAISFNKLLNKIGINAI